MALFILLTLVGLLEAAKHQGILNLYHHKYTGDVSLFHLVSKSTYFYIFKFCRFCWKCHSFFMTWLRLSNARWNLLDSYFARDCTRFVVVDPQGTYYGTGLGGTCSYSPPSMPPVSQHINKLVALNAPQFFGSLSCGMCFRVSFALEKNPQS